MLNFILRLSLYSAWVLLMVGQLYPPPWPEKTGRSFSYLNIKSVRSTHSIQAMFAYPATELGLTCNVRLVVPTAQDWNLDLLTYPMLIILILILCQAGCYNRTRLEL